MLQQALYKYVRASATLKHQRQAKRKKEKRNWNVWNFVRNACWIKSSLKWRQNETIERIPSRERERERVKKLKVEGVNFSNNPVEVSSRKNPRWRSITNTGQDLFQFLKFGLSPLYACRAVAWNKRYVKSIFRHITIVHVSIKVGQILY